MGVTEAIITAAFESCEISLTSPFEHMTYHDAINTYGTDAPDLRYGMAFGDVTDILVIAVTRFLILLQAVGGQSKALRSRDLPMN